MTRSLCLTLCLLCGCLSQPVRVSHAPANDHSKRLAIVSTVAGKIDDERLRNRIEVLRLLETTTIRCGLVPGAWPELSAAVDDAVGTVKAGKDGVPVPMDKADRVKIAAGLKAAVRAVK